MLDKWRTPSVVSVKYDNIYDKYALRSPPFLFGAGTCTCACENGSCGVDYFHFTLNSSRRSRYAMIKRNQSLKGNRFKDVEVSSVR